MTSWSVEETSEEQASPWKSRCATSAFSQQLLSLKHVMLLCFQNWIVSEKGLDQLPIVEELREFEVANLIYCSATTLLEFSAISKTFFFFFQARSPTSWVSLFTGLDCQTGTTGLTFLPLKIIFMPVIRLTTSRVASYGTLACKTPSLLLLNALLTAGRVKWVGAHVYREILCN